MEEPLEGGEALRKHFSTQANKKESKQGKEPVGDCDDCFLSIDLKNIRFSQTCALKSGVHNFI